MAVCGLSLYLGSSESCKSRVKISTIELFQNEIRKLHYTGLKKEKFMIIESKKFCASHEQEIGPISNF